MALTSTFSGRVTSPLIPGKLRQPSVPAFSLPERRTSGLSKIRGIRDSGSTSLLPTHMALGRSRTPVMSITHIWTGTPTCWAASPTPLAASMVSSMSPARRRRLSSTTSIRLPLALKAGWPYCTISKIMAKFPQQGRGWQAKAPFVSRLHGGAIPLMLIPL